MKKSMITMSLTMLASSVNATTTENVAKEFSLSLVDSLVELQLQTACKTHVSSAGEQVVTVDSDCVSNVNELLATLEKEPSAAKLVQKVRSYMDANNIPVNRAESFFESLEDRPVVIVSCPKNECGLTEAVEGLYKRENPWLTLASKIKLKL
ncbi:hypothetical protein B6A42_27015 (plasmid) [Vibrio coralliilyticus]|nr:hypothetical protein B6A42_27015 [Vibrio coralliilyticus]